jgi:hypothetical protein
LKLIQNQKYSFLTAGTPTYWPSDPDKILDLLDFYITSGISPSYMGIASSYDLSSDHIPIIAMVSTEPVNKKKPPPGFITGEPTGMSSGLEPATLRFVT